MAQVLQFSDVSFVRDGREILSGINWIVNDEERWVVLGPNGAGKTTLLSIAGARIHPSSGEVLILGEQLGRSDVFELRPRIGLASSSLDKQIPDSENVLDVVLTAAYAVTGRWREVYEDIDTRRAIRVLRQWGLEALADRSFGTLSDGERKRVQIARAVMTDPEMLLLDEPSSNLDLGAREEMLFLLGGYAQEESTPAIVMVTHHVEEIPAGFTHALLLRDGKVSAAGPIAEALTSETLSETFGRKIDLQQHDGRFTARATL